MDALTAARGEVGDDGGDQRLLLFLIEQQHFRDRIDEPGWRVSIPAPGVIIHIHGKHLERLKAGFQERRFTRLVEGPDRDGAVIERITRQEVKK